MVLLLGFVMLILVYSFFPSSLVWDKIIAGDQFSFRKKTRVPPWDTGKIEGGSWQSWLEQPAPSK